MNKQEMLQEEQQVPHQDPQQLPMRNDEYDTNTRANILLLSAGVAVIDGAAVSGITALIGGSTLTAFAVTAVIAFPISLVALALCAASSRASRCEEQQYNL